MDQLRLQDYQATVMLGENPESSQASVATIANQSTVDQSSLVDMSQEDGYLELIRTLKSDLASKTSECEILKIKLNETNQDYEVLSQELDECRLAIFENNEDSRKTNEEILKSKKLEEDCVKLMSDLLDLREQSDYYKQNMMDKYILKTNAINNLECLYTSGALTSELNQYKLDLNDKMAELSLAQAKVRNLEDENSIKDKSIVELKKSLEDAKITHLHEIKVLEEYIACLKNTVNSYEKTLANYDLKSQREEEENISVISH